MSKQQNETKLDAWTQAVVDALADAGLWPTSINARLTMAAKLRSSQITPQELAQVVSDCVASCSSEDAGLGHAVNVLRDGRKLAAALRAVRRRAEKQATMSSRTRPLQVQPDWTDLDYATAIGALVHHDRYSLADAAGVLGIGLARAEEALATYLADRGDRRDADRPLPPWLRPRDAEKSGGHAWPF